MTDATAWVVGQPAIISSRDQRRTGVIEKVLAKHVVISGAKYRLRDGSRVGDYDVWNCVRAKPATAEEAAAVARELAANVLRDDIYRAATALRVHHNCTDLERLSSVRDQLLALSKTEDDK